MKATINTQLTADHTHYGQKSAKKLTAGFTSVQNFVTHLGPTGRGFIFLLVLLLVAVSAMALIFPRSVTPAGASLEVFSGERALKHLPIIASEEHRSGSPAQAKVRDYLVQQLTNIGVEVEVQQEPGLENVVARLHGAAPTGAVLLLAHYDSIGGPGAADNGAGVAALLEVMRALASGTAPRNDIIVLFDDSEEIPDEFTGTKAFIRKHPWMADVRVAVGLDTAAQGFICVDDTGSNNGWMVQALARAYTGGAWTSVSGGGSYDTKPFRQAGIQVLELEDNYPFHEQHTPGDVPEIVNPGTVQQLGDQALAVTRELGSLDLSNTRGEQETFIFVPFLGLAHYPEAWALPLAIAAAVLLVGALALSLWRKFASFGGLGVAILVMGVTAGLSALGTNALWQAAPDMFGWETYRWPDWPEVIPPYGWHILLLSYLVILVLAVITYRLARRWSARGNFSLVGLSIFLVLAVFVAKTTPRSAIIYTWPVLIGAASWVLAAVIGRSGKEWAVEAGALLAAIPVVLYIVTLLPVIFMSDGTKSVAITAGVWVIVLGIILPAVDNLLVRPKAVSG